MKLCPRFPWVALLAAAMTARPAVAADPSAAEFFEKEVRPLLIERCQTCHGDQKQKGGLKLTSRAAILQGGESGPAAVPGKPDDSLLVKAVRQAGELKMPPTPEEIDAFLADPSPDAFAKVVNRLLASPAYGERWGRRWLDLARYTDSFDARLGPGDVMDATEAWRYRDWVVNAFNRDLPYDQFVRDQVAGDVLPGRRVDGIIATGLLAIGNWGGGDAD